MIKENQLAWDSRRERLRYGLGAVCIGIAALLLLLSFHGGAAKELAAPLAPTITKSFVTSITDTNNTIMQAVAGELVTVTVVYNVPSEETIYDASPRVLLQDGLYPIGSNPDWDAMHTGTATTAQLRSYEPLAARSGALVIFPNQGTITGPATLTMVVRAVRTQYQYVGSGEIGTTNLRIQGVIRYCADAPDCASTTAVNNDDSTPAVGAIRPDINVVATPTYLDADGIGAGGEQVRLTFIATNASGRPTAHDIVFTATLGSGLTYDASHGGDGAGAGTASTIGDVTYVAWNVPVSLVGGAGWQAVITATLPSTFTIGTQFAHGAHVVYETFAGDMAYEGVYTRLATMTPLMPGLVHSKRSNLPTGTNIRIGEMLTYTVMFTQGANTNLPNPYYTDDLPLGFHYISGTLDVQGGAVITGVTVTTGTVASGGFIRERLSWFMESMPVSANARYITAVYEAHNTGVDYKGDLVWAATATDFTSARSSPNSAVLNWRPPAGISVNSLAAVNASVNVYQPYLGNLTYFKTARTDANPYTLEVGQLVRFKSEFRNTGRAPAYDAILCDQLPTGLVLDTQIAIFYSAGFPNRIVEPQADDNLLCWELDVIPIATTYSVEYYARILDTVIPGVPLANNFHAVDYTSMPGDVSGERHYNLISIAVPSVTCPGADCLSVLGLTVNKTPWQANVGPGALVTYTLSYEDTSAQFNYQNVVLTDTFDADLVSFVDATPLPTQQSAGQMVWNVGDLVNTGGEIVLTMEVADVIPDGVYELLNNLSWSSAEIPLHTITRSVALQAANLNLTMYGPANVHANQDIIYTVVYSNTGSAPTSPVVLTLDYGPYVEFVSSSPLTPRSGTDNVFDDTVPSTGANRTLTVNLRVKAPLPYDLAGPLMASALLESAGAEAKQANISMTLDRPVLVLEKTGPQVAPGEGQVLPYTIRIHNQGTYTATGAVITDTWGPYLAYNAAENALFGWTLSGDGTYATQSLGELGIGEIVTKLFQMTVAENSIFYMNTVNLASDQTTEQEEIEYTWQKSIATSKSATPVPAFPGRTLTYTIYYTNTAPDPMLNARITDTLPSDFVYQAQSAPQGGCQSAWTFIPPAGDGGDAVWTCSALTANGSGYFTISGHVKTEAEGTDLENSTLTSADNIPVRPIDKPLITPVVRPWLRVDKAAVPAHPIAPGDLLTYTLTYENYGTDSAYNVIIKDQLPAQVTYVSCSGGDSCSQSGGLVTWNLAEVPVDTVSSVRVVVQVNADTAGQTALNVNYTIQSDRLPVAETITGNPVSSTILAPHLAAEKLVGPPYVTQAGNRITYTIQLTNDGGGILHNVMITDAIDPRTNVDQPTLPPACTVSGESGVNEVVTCDIGTMAQGAVRVVQFKVYLAGEPTQGGAINNTAYSYSDETASEPSNETTVWVTTGCIPLHNVDFTVSANPQAGQPVTFSASAAGDTPMTFTWAFGDTQTGSGQVVQHTYAVSGTYKVDLTANNGCIAPVTISKDVFVPGAPEIAWTPANPAQSADEGSTTILQDTLTVSNAGTTDLLWSAEVMTPTEATWLKIAVGAGSPETFILPQVTAPNTSTPVTVYFDPTGLTAGVYTGWLRVESNDADEGTVLVRVTFTVRSDYYIYLPLVLKNY